MMWPVWLLVGCAFVLVGFHVFGSKPDREESDDERLERECGTGLITEDEYLRRKAKLPHA